MTSDVKVWIHIPGTPVCAEGPGLIIFITVFFGDDKSLRSISHISQKCVMEEIKTHAGVDRKLHWTISHIFYSGNVFYKI